MNDLCDVYIEWTKGVLWSGNEAEKKAWGRDIVGSRDEYVDDCKWHSPLSTP